jgi:hypothetical protein
MYSMPPKLARKDAPAHRLFRAVAKLPASERLFLAWWCIHIPITLCIDLQGLLAQYYPSTLRSVVLWWEETAGDPYMYAGARGGVPWFRSFLAAEGLFQLPLFFVFIWSIFNKRAWIDAISLVYVGHVVTTVYTIYFELLSTKNVLDSLSSEQLAMLLGAYTPYLVVPIFWGIRCWNNLLGGAKTDEGAVEDKKAPAEPSKPSVAVPKTPEPVAAGSASNGAAADTGSKAELTRTPSTYNTFMKEELVLLKRLYPEKDHKELFKKAAGNVSRILCSFESRTNCFCTGPVEGLPKEPKPLQMKVKYRAIYSYNSKTLIFNT